MFMSYDDLLRLDSPIDPPHAVERSHCFMRRDFSFGTKHHLSGSGRGMGASDLVTKTSRQRFGYLLPCGYGDRNDDIEAQAEW